MQASQNGSSKVVPLLMISIGLVLAAAAVYAARTSFVLRYEMKQLQDENDSLKKQLATTGTTNQVEAVAPATDKEAEIARLKAELEKAKKSVVPEALMPRVAGANTDTNRVSGLERLRESDPERYKQIMDAREQRRKQADSFFQEQQTRLDDRLKVAQTQEEADLVGQISDALNKMSELRKSWEAAGQMSDEDRRKLGADSWQTYQTYAQLREKDRQLQLSQLASQIGYQNPRDAEQFTAAVNRILKETDASMGRMMGGGFGRGGRGGGQGGQ